MNWRHGSLQWGFNTGSCGRRPPVLRDHWIIALVMCRWVKIGPLSDMNKAAGGQSVFVFVVRLVGDFLLIRAVEPRHDARHPQMCHLHWLLSGFPHGEVQQQTLLVHHHISQTSKQTTTKKQKQDEHHVQVPRTCCPLTNAVQDTRQETDSASRETSDLSATWIVKCCPVYYDSNYSTRHQRDGLHNPSTCILPDSGFIFESIPIKVCLVLPRSLCFFFQGRVSIKIERTKRNLSQCETLCPSSDYHPIL